MVTKDGWNESKVVVNESRMKVFNRPRKCTDVGDTALARVELDLQRRLSEVGDLTVISLCSPIEKKSVLEGQFALDGDMITR